MRAGSRALLVSVAFYVACIVAGYFLRVRYPRAHPASEIGGVVLALAMCAVFVAVAARLAVTGRRAPVRVSVAVSMVAVALAGLIRTALAANGMWRLLMWDHEDVVYDAVVESLYIALLSGIPALAVAGAARVWLRWRAGRASIPSAAGKP